MINPFLETNWRPGGKDIRNFGRSMLIGFSAVSTVFLVVNLFRVPFDEAVAVPASIFLAGVFFFLVSKLGVAVAKPFYLLWHFLAACIGIVMANLLLMTFYYLFFSVFAVLFRVSTGRDPLRLKKDPNRRSWWFERRGERDLKSYFKQY